MSTKKHFWRMAVSAAAFGMLLSTTGWGAKDQLPQTTRASMGDFASPQPLADLPLCPGAKEVACMNIVSPDDCGGNPAVYGCPAGYTCCRYAGNCDSRCASPTGAVVPSVKKKK